MQQIPAEVHTSGHTCPSGSMPCIAAGPTHSSHPPQPAFQHFRGHAAILRVQPLLAALAAQCGQAGTMDHIAFFLTVPYFGRKLPHLLLWSDAAGQPSAAVMVNEYVFAGRRTGIFIAVDSGGERTVLSSPLDRARTAFRASRYLFANGAYIVLLSLANLQPHDFALSLKDLFPRFTSATQTRTLLRELRLQASFDQTLAGMGPHTRRNLRCYARRAQSALAARFVSNAEISRTQFQQLNLQCSYPVPTSVSAWRYDSALSAPRGFLSGLRGGDGAWLSLIGGRRFTTPLGTVTAIDWQMNRTELRAYSLGTAMRAFFLEHEVRCGHRAVRFEGGTPHAMRNAFTPEKVTDMLLARPALCLRLLRAALPLLPAGGLLADTLSSPDLR